MRRALHFSAWIAGGLTLLILVLGAALFIAGNTDPGRAMIEKLTRRLTSGHVSLSGLKGSFPQHLLLERLQLSDYRGVWLTAERVSLDWSPLALLARRLQIDSLHAAAVEVERLPESPPDAPSSGPASLPRIDVAGMTVDKLRIGARLARTPATFVLKGSAHLRSVQDMIIDASAHRIDGDGDYVLQLRFDPRRMDADLHLHEPAGGPLESLLQLPGLGALEAAVNLNGPRTSERLEASIDAGALHGRAQGTLNLSDLSADFQFAVDSPALAPRSDLSWERASVHGRWHGGIKAPRVEGQIAIERLRLPGDTQLAAVNGEISAESGTAALRAVIDGLRIPGPRPQLLQDSPLKVDASMRLDDDARPLEVSASHRLFSLRAAAQTAAAPGRDRSATAELRLPSLTELAALAGQTVHGSALVKAQMRDDGKAAHLTVDASAALRAGTEIWSGLVGDNATLQLAGVLTERAITLDSMKFASRFVSLTASGNLLRNPSELHLRWDMNASDLKAVSPMFAGTLRADGRLDGPITAFAGEAQLTSTLSVRGSASGELSAAVKMQGLPSSPSGTAQAHGMLDGAPLQVDVSLERGSEGSLRTVIHRADWKSARADGDITLAPVAARSHGQLRLRIGQLADLQDVIGTNVAGSLTGDLSLRADPSRTHAQVRIDAQGLTVGKIAANVQLSAEGVTNALEFKLDMQVPNLRGAQASLTAGGSFDLDARKIAVTSATANYHGQDLRLLAPAQIALADVVSVDVLRIGAQTAVLQVEGELSPVLDMRASVRDLQPALINVLYPGLLASGTIEAHAQLKGSVEAPTGEVRLTASDIRMADDAALGLPALDLHATAQLMGDTAEIDARLVAGTASKLSLTGRAPLAADGALRLKVSGALDIGMINPMLEARGQHAVGALEVDATVAGSVAAPLIEGTVNITHGSMRDYVRGLSLTNVTAAIIGSEGNLEIKSLTASAAPGTVSMTGKIGVLQAGIPVDLHIKADNAQPLASKLVTSNLNADLHLSGTARERLDIAGSVHLNRTLIGIPNSLPPDVAVLDVRRRGKTAAQAAPDRPLVIGLDVALQAPQEILVQGRGLDAEMGGDLHLGGTLAAPAVSGSFGLLRGNFSLAGNKLNFVPEESRVTFDGAGLKNKIDPTLEFTATTTVSGTTATLRISGLADAPQFEFTSAPPLGQDEIMALLLFGTSVQQLSPLQLAQIGTTLATLSGVGGDGGLNPLVKLQKSLGLDRLTVGSGTANTPTGPENAGASIAAGRYLSKRVYIEAKQTTQGTSQLQTDVDLTKHLKLQTRLGNGTNSVQGTTPENDPGSSVGLSYQFEY